MSISKSDFLYFQLAESKLKLFKKYYFFDNGIRNALVAQFNRLDQRNDIGALWENFIFIERLKYRKYNSIYANMYFGGHTKDRR